ncbi:hypothetical protein QVD17_24123 [Tagetes erecta]|uniref:Bifunctional inhibitor/plant lipid transfer protein/seed storage helical domain-containing protein n=1 Tax=Tagetes erecta TaxID=13708 RepID=A0AAD8NUN8_TARER|nr:hypothetical protein QVD17_24123 [Tagetes erecta]
MATSSSSSLTIIITLLLIATSISPAQSQAQTCASKLVSCAPYLNTTTTSPNTCYDPIKQAVATDLPCLCNLYANPSFLSGIGVNITQALRLPRLCGITSDTSICKNGSRLEEALVLLLIRISINQMHSLPKGSTAAGLSVAMSAYIYTFIFCVDSVPCIENLLMKELSFPIVFNIDDSHHS